MNPLNKNFKIPGEHIRQLISNMGGCFATDRITVDGLKVGYMFRELPDKDVFSGWTFMAGDESQEYADNPDNWAILRREYHLQLRSGHYSLSRSGLRFGIWPHGRNEPV